MSGWERLCSLSRELDDTRRKLQKADHDRRRYKKRIRFLDLCHQALCGAYHALLWENEILSHALDVAEKRLMQNGETETDT